LNNIFLSTCYNVYIYSHIRITKLTCPSKIRQKLFSSHLFIVSTLHHFMKYTICISSLFVQVFFLLPCLIVLLLVFLTKVAYEPFLVKRSLSILVFLSMSWREGSIKIPQHIYCCKEYLSQWKKTLHFSDWRSWRLILCVR
jgi:hypothetical protein